MRAIGFNPREEANSWLVTSIAAAPSFSPEELPAVTVPSLRKAGLSFERASRDVSRLGRSSVFTMIGLPFLCGIVTGTISSANFPESMAEIAL